MGVVGLVTGKTPVVLPGNSSGPPVGWAVTGAWGVVVAVGLILGGAGWLWALKPRPTEAPPAAQVGGCVAVGVGVVLVAAGSLAGWFAS